MSFIDQLINVSITIADAPPSQSGVDVPLIAAYHTRWNERVREYSDLAGLAADGFFTTDPAYKLAAVEFSQTPRPPKVKIGRRVAAFTQVVHVTPADPDDAGTVETYAFELDGLTATFTTDGTPTVPEVCTGLAAAINALGDADAILAGGASTAGLQTLTGALSGVIGRTAMDPPRALTMTLSNSTDWDATTAVVTGTNAKGVVITENFAIPNNGDATVTGLKYFRTVTQVVIPAQTGAGGTFTVGVRAPVTADGTSGTHVVCTAPVAGELHSFKLLAPNPSSPFNLGLTDATTDPGLAADLDAILLADGDWYGLSLDSNGAAEIEAAAAWTEASRKLFTAQTADAGAMDGESTTDVLAVLQGLGYTRTVPYFAPSIGTNWLAAGALAERLPAQPGSDTWAYKTPAAVTTYALTDTQRTAILAKNGNVFTVIGGQRKTYPGKTASGLFADTVRFVDWLRLRGQARLFGLVTRTGKLPYTDAAVDVVRAELLALLDEGISVGGLAPDPKPTVTTPRVADVSAEVRASRNLPSVAGSARLAGAIHTINPLSLTVSA